MVMLDPFKGDGYSLTSLTQAVNKLPNRFGRLQELNLMPFVGVTTRTITLEEKNGVLTMVPIKPWGSPGTQNISGKRKERTFAIPHMPMEDSILASDVQGVRSFGTENEAQAFNQKVQEKLQEMRDKIDQTLEWRRFGALKGVIYDADASTVIYNLYTEFSINQKTVDFALGTTTTDVRAKCLEVKRHIEDNLFGERMTGIRVLVSPEFYDKLTGHTTVKATFANWQAAQERLGGDQRGGFEYGGLIFEEYRAQTSGSDGALKRYIAANDGHAFPEGTVNTFKTHAAPADFVETVNTIGLPFYAKMEPMKFGRGMDVHVQSNVLPLCARPEVLVRVYSSN
jgi:hypothetical protein